MAEEEEVDKYKRLYEEQRAKVKELERQNSQLKDVVQQLMAAGRQGANHKGSGSISGSVGGGAAGGDSRAGPRAGRGRPGGARGANHPPAPSATGGSGGGRGRGNAGSNQRTSQPSSTANSERQDAQGSAAAGSAVEARPVKPEPEPSEPDVRADIVALMRAASMGMDKEKLEAAVKQAEEAGLHFEANLGRRQLARITG